MAERKRFDLISGEPKKTVGYETMRRDTVTSQPSTARSTRTEFKPHLIGRYPVRPQSAPMPKKAPIMSVAAKKAAMTGMGGELLKEDRPPPRKEYRVSKSSKVPDHTGRRLPKEGQITGPQLLAIEDKMRRAVIRQRDISETETHMLTTIFQDVDDGSGAISEEEFIRAWRRLKIVVTENEAAALFAKHPTNYSGELRYVKFTETIMKGVSRNVGNTGVHVGFPVTDKHFKGKIVYPMCRKGVFAPSDFDISLADRSTFLPDASLTLAFVFGYAGLTNTAPNLFYICTGEVVYYTAAVGVVYNKETHMQRHFRNHTDDVKCLVLCRAPVNFRGVKYPAKCLVATGQVKPVEDGSSEERECPYVLIWDARTMKQLVKIPHPCENRACVAVAFSPRGDKLVTVTCDNQHTVSVWDWRREGIGQELASGGTVGLLCSGKGYPDRPIGVYGAMWNPHSETEEFLTFGTKHVKLWTGAADAMRGRMCAFGSLPVDNVVAAEFMPCPIGQEGTTVFVTGMPRGQIYVWRNGRAMRSIDAHAKGPKITTVEGNVTYAGVRCLKLRADGCTLLSGGADGMVHTWNVTGSKIAGKRGDGMKLQAGHATAALPSLVALDSRPESDVFVAGTSMCDIWEVGPEGPDQLIYGHAANLDCVATHPAKPNIFISASASSRLFLWDADIRSLLRSTSTNFQNRSCVFSQLPFYQSKEEERSQRVQGHHIAVGGKHGRVCVLDEMTFEPIMRDHWATSGVDVLKYSPDNLYLAAGTHDTTILIYQTGGKAYGGYFRHRKCVGHSTTITQLDWSIDSSIIQSNDQAGEILYWKTSGQQVKVTQRNQFWQTWTCVLGFPVMGIWRPGHSLMDVNSLCRSTSGEYVVIADNYSTIHLMHYPCVTEHSPSRSYGGHSSFVTCVRFLCDDRRLISSGGRDRAIFLYETHAMSRDWEWRQCEKVQLPQKHAGCDLVECYACGSRPPPPLPPPVWQPTDGPDGKLWGWVQPPRPDKWPDEMDSEQDLSEALAESPTGNSTQTAHKPSRPASAPARGKREVAFAPEVTQARNDLPRSQDPEVRGAWDWEGTREDEEQL